MDKITDLFKLLDEKLLYRVGKFFLLLMPIFLISKNVYFHYYATQNSATLDWSDINFIMKGQYGYMYIIIFISIYLAVYILQVNILPYALLSFRKKFKKEDFLKHQNVIIIEKGIPDFGIALEKVRKKITAPDKTELISQIIFYPISFILWLIWIGNIYSYIGILFIVLVTFYIVKIVNGFLYHQSNL